MLTLVGFSFEAPTSAAVLWQWSGAITPNSVRIKARIGADSTIVRALLSESADMANPIYSPPDTALSLLNNRVVDLRVGGLRPDARYFYAVEVNGFVDSATAIGRTRTVSDSARSFTFALGSCARTGSTSAVFDSIRNRDPLFFFHLGDFHYENIAVNQAAVFRSAFETVLASLPQANLYRDVPIAYVWDDHDFGPNNSDSTAPGRLAARMTYQEYVPHYPLAFGSGNVSINQAFTIGRVRFIVCDSRSARSPAFAADNASKTMLGKAQKEWFKKQLLAANGRFPLIVWVNTMPWIGVTGDDGWHLYTTERRELADFIKANQIRGLCMISGDAHMLAIDDGSHSDYATGGGAAFPVMHAAALDQSGSLKGGPYSHGAYPGGGQFGLMSIDDDGDSLITVRWSGRNVAGSELVAHTFAVDARPIVCGDADSDGALALNDAVRLIDYIFGADPTSITLSEADANGNLTASIADAVFLIEHLFNGGPAPKCAEL